MVPRLRATRLAEFIILTEGIDGLYKAFFSDLPIQKALPLIWVGLHIQVWRLQDQPLSTRRLALVCQIPRGTVQRYLKELKRRNYLRREKNKLHLNDEIGSDELIRKLAQEIIERLPDFKKAC